MCSLAKQQTVFKWKDAISGFPVSQGSAEALDRWGGKLKHRLISYFLSNTSATNYRNRVVYAKIIASQRWDVFLRHSVHHDIWNSYLKYIFSGWYNTTNTYTLKVFVCITLFHFKKEGSSSWVNVKLSHVGVWYEISLSLNRKIATQLFDKFYENCVQMQKLQAEFCPAVLVFTCVINTSCCSNENIELSIEIKKLTSTVQSFSIMS